MIKHHFYPLCLTSAVLWHSPASHWYFPDTPSQTIWKGFHLVFTLSRLASRLFKVKNAETMFLALNMKSGERQKKKRKKPGGKKAPSGQQSISNVTRLFNTLQSYFHVCSKPTASMGSRRILPLAAYGFVASVPKTSPLPHLHLPTTPAISPWRAQDGWKPPSWRVSAKAWSSQGWVHLYLSKSFSAGTDLGPFCPLSIFTEPPGM